MTRYKSFQDIQERDKDLAQYFLQPDMAVDWIMGITNGIVKWVADKRDKGLWEVVRFVSYKRGVISKTLSREKFAKLVCTYCKEALKEGETYTKLRQSMEQSKYIPEIKTFDKLPDSHRLRTIVSDIEHFFDERDFEPSSEQSTPSISERLETYLRNIVDVESIVYPCSRIFMNPDYGNGINPTIAVEVYHNEAFLNARKPSNIEAYECISGALDLKTLYSYIGLYEGRRNIKLYIVSASGLSNEVYSLAEMKGIGYVRINPQKNVVSDSFVLPRSIADTSARVNNFNILFERTEMLEPLVIWDGQRISTSLADMLKDHGIDIKSHHRISVPHITYEKIEAKADELTKEHLEICKQTIKDIHGRLFVEKSKFVEKKTDYGQKYVERYDYKEYFDMSINPFTLAEKQGLYYEVKELPSSQLGRMDLLSQTVALNEIGYSNYERIRFTMAHELGHYVIHVPLISGMGIVSFGETTQTISNEMPVDNEDRMWFERHANHFASCVLMPRKLVLMLYSILYYQFVTKKYGDPLGSLYYNEKQPETWDSYNNIVGGLAKILCVSVTAMKFRLQHLNLLIEA
ncbi:MAG: ImmA/IrrE family metallo-endopeptidase [Prevotella sp.]|nr:ImmA/IrrE family metallo-endopeptidase [Prevotella sp.]